MRFLTTSSLPSLHALCSKLRSSLSFALILLAIMPQTSYYQPPIKIYQERHENEDLNMLRVVPNNSPISVMQAHQVLN